MQEEVQQPFSSPFTSNSLIIKQHIKTRFALMMDNALNDAHDIHVLLQNVQQFASYLNDINSEVAELYVFGRGLLYVDHKTGEIYGTSPSVYYNEKVWCVVLNGNSFLSKDMTTSHASLIPLPHIRRLSIQGDIRCKFPASMLSCECAIHVELESSLTLYGEANIIALDINASENARIDWSSATLTTSNQLNIFASDNSRIFGLHIQQYNKGEFRLSVCDSATITDCSFLGRGKGFLKATHKGIIDVACIESNITKLADSTGCIICSAPTPRSSSN
jgi:hypothetical protein